MRISDWSSDVCSSDLRSLAGHGPNNQVFRHSEMCRHTEYENIISPADSDRLALGPHGAGVALARHVLALSNRLRLRFAQRRQILQALVGAGIPGIDRKSVV